MANYIFLTSSVHLVAGDIGKKLEAKKRELKLLFIDTATEVEQDDKQWMKNDRDALVDAGFAAANMANTGASLFLNASIGLTGWTGALLFTGKTIYSIYEWNEDLRDAASAANLYMIITNDQKCSSLYLEESKDYLQYLFYKHFSEVMNRNNLKFWELFKIMSQL